MPNTYKAILRGDHVEWIDRPPRHAGPTTVHITLLEEALAPASGDVMADALEALANAGGISSIANPIRWQREQRQDRPLPGYDAA